MPTYEFACDKCELIFEHIYIELPKRIPKSKKCPECGKKAEKIMSAGVFHMKGRPYRLGKTEVNVFYNEAIRDSKHRLNVDTAYSPYKRYKPNYDVLVKEGKLRKMSQKEIDSRKAQTDKVKENIINTTEKLLKKKKK